MNSMWDSGVHCLGLYMPTDSVFGGRGAQMRVLRLLSPLEVEVVCLPTGASAHLRDWGNVLCVSSHGERHCRAAGASGKDAEEEVPLLMGGTICFSGCCCS